MNQRDRAQRRLNEQRAKAEREAIARELASKPRNDRRVRIETSEAIGTLAAWCRQQITDNERRGLSVGC
jgi:hypothetical protein